MILVKTPQPNADSIGPLVNQGLASIDRGQVRRGSLSTPLHHHGVSYRGRHFDSSFIGYFNEFFKTIFSPCYRADFCA